MAVLEALAARRDFTKTDEALADYILAHADEVVRMSVSELSSRTYTSSAAVNRLCRKVGTSGFRAFRVDLNTELERRRMGTGVAADLRVGTGQSVIDTMADVGAIYRKAIDATLATVSAVELRDAARDILHADRVVLYAGGDSAVACEQFANDLLRIGIPSVAAYRYMSLWASTRMAGRDDVALFVTYSGQAIFNFVDHARAIHEAGARIVLVSSFEPDRALRHIVDHLLALPTGERIVESVGTFFSQMCVRYVLSCLYATAYSIDAERSEAHRSAVITPDWSPGAPR